MFFPLRHWPVLTAALLVSLFHGTAPAQEALSPADYLAISLQQDALLMGGVVDPILDDARVTPADKDLVRKAVKPMQDAMAKMTENFKANPAPTQGSIQADQPNVVQSSLAMMTLLNDRPDLMWVSRHGQSLREMKGHMLQDKSAEFLALVEAAGVAEAPLGSIKSIAEQFQADLAVLKKQAVAAPSAARSTEPSKSMAQTQALTIRTPAAVKTIDVLLTADQLADLNWAVVKAMTDNEISENRTVRYCTQPGESRAPVAGTYVLKTDPSRNGAGVAPAQLTSVTLKKGDTLGFKKTDKLVALADTQIIDLPADAGLMHWEFSPPPKP